MNNYNTVSTGDACEAWLSRWYQIRHKKFNREMFSRVWSLETAMMMPNTLCLLEQLYPIQLCQFH